MNSLINTASKGENLDSGSPFSFICLSFDSSLQGNEKLHFGKIILRNGNLNKQFEKNRIEVSQENDQNFSFDEYKLVKVEKSAIKFESNYREWYIHFAILAKFINQVGEEEIRRKLMMLQLLGYSKATCIHKELAQELGWQVSPFMQQEEFYHRIGFPDGNHALFNAVEKECASLLNISIQNILLIDSPLIKEALSREFSFPFSYSDIIHKEDLKKTIEKILYYALLNKWPKAGSWISIDVSFLIDGLTPQNQAASFKEILKGIQKDVVDFIEATAGDSLSKIKAKLFLSQLFLYSTIPFEGKYLLCIGKVLAASKNIKCDPKHFDLDHQLKEDIQWLVNNQGYRIDPVAIRDIWIKVRACSDPIGLIEGILASQKLPAPVLAIIGDTIPVICPTISGFLSQPVFGKFGALSKESLSFPYLEIIPQATCDLLSKFQELRKNEKTIDEVFSDKGLHDLLQIHYFRLLNAMNEAILRKETAINFLNEIEVIHQGIQLMLSIMEPYGPGDLQEAIRMKLQTREDPIVPKDLVLTIYPKLSAMRSLSSVISAVEAEKGDHRLGVVSMKYSYYEIRQLLEDVAHYHQYTFNGDLFREKGIGAAMKAPDFPLDLFIGEFHHNAHPKRDFYQKEMIAEPVIEMEQLGYFAKKFTVALDATIDSECSENIRSLLHHPQIRELILNGRMNLVFYRSGQKFDMLGLDNYYGGIACCVNDGHSFSTFTNRMDHPLDRLEGLSYQGLSHLHSTGKIFHDLYREKVKENTKKFYDLLPSKMVQREGSKNPIRISEIDAEAPFFIDIKMKDYKKAAQVLLSEFAQFAFQKRLPLTDRGSFGFPAANLVSLDSECFRLNLGLISEESINSIAHCFHLAQNFFDQLELNNSNRNDQEKDEWMVNQIKNWVRAESNKLNS